PAMFVHSERRPCGLLPGPQPGPPGGSGTGRIAGQRDPGCRARPPARPGSWRGLTGGHHTGELQLERPRATGAAPRAAVRAIRPQAGVPPVRAVEGNLSFAVLSHFWLPSRALRWLREAGPRRPDTATAAGAPYAAFGPAPAACRAGLSSLAYVSYQEPFVGAAGPGGELLAFGPVGEVVAQNPLDVVGQPVGGHLQAAQFPAERGIAAERSPQVHLEALAAVHDRPLQPDVGDLEPGAGVGAAVDVDADRGVEAGQPPVKFGVEVLRPLLGLHDRQLAELDAGAGHRAPAERRRAHLQVTRGEFLGQLADPAPGHVEDQQLLLRGGADRAGAVFLGQVGDLPELGAGGTAHVRRHAQVVPSVLLPVHPDVVARAGRRRGRLGAAGQCPAEVFLLQHLAEALGAPVGDQELQPRPGAQPPVAVV